jgi:hypothetical protein
VTEAEPLVPANADVRGFKDMPIEVSRLLSSETWIMCTPEERSAAINLWLQSWTQVPAGSLADNDRVLAHLSMAGDRWPDVREMALRGWEKADDGRLYHAVVCEKVMKVWKPFSGARKAISSCLREIIFERDGYVCRYCGDEKGPFHIDHIVPVAKGGDNNPLNLTVSCQCCNLSKGSKTLEEWHQ